MQETIAADARIDDSPTSLSLAARKSGQRLSAPTRRSVAVGYRIAKSRRCVRAGVLSATSTAVRKNRDLLLAPSTFVAAAVKSPLAGETIFSS